ncbi:MAG: DUF3343 domain-containing protein [Mobilibacterium timonense]|uniref:DUF3343 domain-containing protein n=1 Tax=Mobilibacterium timonense TaxID=1871012 RepID=UPI00235200C2|nr:DUF3343 domain-containing protein [Mobilibacterium timonense]MBM6991137.1 DUF3343 domain-containing protein [Mobilibacterium timonense]
MENVSYYILSFDTTSVVMEVWQELGAAGIKACVMPTPRSVQASCGLSVRFQPCDLQAVRDKMNSDFSDVGYKIFTAVKSGGHTSFEPL